MLLIPIIGIQKKYKTLCNVRNLSQGDLSQQNLFDPPSNPVLERLAVIVVAFDAASNAPDPVGCLNTVGQLVHDAAAVCKDLVIPMPYIYKHGRSESCPTVGGWTGSRCG